MILYSNDSLALHFPMQALGLLMRIRLICRSRRPSDSQSDAAGGHRFDNASFPILVDFNFIGFNRLFLSGVQVVLEPATESNCVDMLSGIYKLSGADAGLIGTDEIKGSYLSHFLAFKFLSRLGSTRAPILCMQLRETSNSIFELT